MAMKRSVPVRGGASFTEATSNVGAACGWAGITLAASRAIAALTLPPLPIILLEGAVVERERLRYLGGDDDLLGIREGDERVAAQALAHVIQLPRWSPLRPHHPIHRQKLLDVRMLRLRQLIHRAEVNHSAFV